MGEKEWYTNKELFEQLNGFKNEFQELRSEMKETRNIIKRYNGLREKIERVEEQMEALRAKAKGRLSAWTDIRVWGGWLFALATLAILVGQVIHK